MSTATVKLTERDEALADLRALIQPGETVYTVLRHVARSGMYRVVDLFVMRGNEPRRITWSACKAAGFKYDRRHEGAAMGGCGTDMGFEAVYNLSRVLFADGFECCGEDRCPSNDHTNGDRNYSPDHVHTDPGYALRQRWL
jgi:hypothetical protein